MDEVAAIFDFRCLFVEVRTHHFIHIPVLDGACSIEILKDEVEGFEFIIVFLLPINSFY